jgi:hypothetical protein
MGAKGAPSDGLVATGPARVSVVSAHHRDELPVVKARTELELQDTKGVDLLCLRAGLVRAVLSPAATSVTVRGLPPPGTAVRTAAMHARSIAEAIARTITGE